MGKMKERTKNKTAMYSQAIAQKLEEAKGTKGKRKLIQNDTRCPAYVWMCDCVSECVCVHLVMSLRRNRNPNHSLDCSNARSLEPPFRTKKNVHFIVMLI